MSRAIFVLSHTLALVGMIVLEMVPNKYLLNIFVLVKTVLIFEAVAGWVLIGVFATKLHSPSTINYALTVVRSSKRTPVKLARYIQAWAVVFVALAVGQWVILVSTLLVLAGAMKVRSSAEGYLRGVKIDLKTKSAVIDV